MLLTIHFLLILVVVSCDALYASNDHNNAITPNYTHSIAKVASQPVRLSVITTTNIIIGSIAVNNDDYNYYTIYNKLQPLIITYDIVGFIVHIRNTSPT